MGSGKRMKRSRSEPERESMANFVSWPRRGPCVIEEVVIGLEVVVRVEVREEDGVRIAVEAASV